jgi:two-component system, OmpR family, KDP operon response regulator KdpE
MIKAFVIDDDPKIRKLIRVNLEKREYFVKEMPDGATAIAQMQEEMPDLVIVDLKMPGVDGIGVTSWVRERWDIPVIVLSAYDEEKLKVKALDIGADDYITKPFGHDELLARIRAVMRRSASTEVPTQENRIEIGGLQVDLKARRAFTDGNDMRLTRTEFALLAELARNLDAVLSHDELLARVWGNEYRGSNHYLHVYFGRIRKKMGDQWNVLLDTVPGLGYILRSSAPTPQS